MTILELMPIFREAGHIDSFLKARGIDNEEGDVSIYMKNSLALPNDVTFFTDDQTGGQRVVIINGERWEELLPVFMVQEMVDELKDDLTDDQMAERILHYAIHDA
jgi:hypothetical protein